MQFSILSSFVCLLISNVNSYQELSNDPDVRTLQEYIQINTTVGGNLNSAVAFWSKQARIAKASFTVYEFVENYPVIVIKWPGTNSSLSSILLTTNMDVIDADVADGWTYPPFSGYIDKDGDMYGRGTQEYKSVSVQHFEAICRLRSKKISLLRDFYMVLTPDKEAGSRNGLAPFLESEDFETMNAGFFLIGGVPMPTNEIAVLYREKHAGCGNFYVSYTKYKATQYKLLQKCSDTAYVTVMNFIGPETKLTMGTMPTTTRLYFDAYLAINVKFCDFENMLNGWVTEAGPNIKLDSILIEKSCFEDVIENNPYWTALKTASKNLKIPFNLRTSNGPGEGSIIARAGYPLFGISPFTNTEDLEHAVNERLNINTYLKGIQIFEEIFKELGNIPANKISNNPSDYLVFY